MNVRDYSKSIQSYKTALDRFENNDQLPKHNRKLCLKWMAQKQKELEEGLTPDQRKRDEHRRAKTMYKYVSMLTNVSHWFPDLKKITLKELKKFKDDFYNDRVKGVKGRALKCKSDYVNKVFKSDFFRWLGHKKIVEDTFTNGVKVDAKTVEFLIEDDLAKMIKAATYDYHRVALYVLYYTGVRIGTLLNLKKNDFELKYNPKTKVSYYHLHVRRDYTKSKADRTIPVIDSKANQALTDYMEKLQGNDFLIPINYRMVYKLIQELAEKTKVRTKPSKSMPNVHTLRKSCAIYLLNKGYSTDHVKAWLGHKPSSDAIDVYVNYTGLKFEPEVARVQADELMRLEQTIKDNATHMAALQQQFDDMKDYVKKMEVSIKYHMRKGAKRDGEPFLKSSK